MYKTTDQVLQPKTDFDTQVKDKNLSVKPCMICDKEVGVRDVRKPVLCHLHTNKSASISRYTNFQHGKLTAQEKQKIMNDKTTRRGPFLGGK